MMISTPMQPLNGIFGDAGGDVIIYMDFVNSIFWDGSDFVTAAEAVDLPAQITGSGLEVETDEVNLLGAFLAFLVAADWTIVIEYEITVDTSFNTPIVISDDGGDYYIELTRKIPAAGRDMNLAEQGTSVYREAEDTDSHGLGVHKIAFTRTNSKLVLSVDGSAAISDAASSDLPTMTKAAFGGYPGFGANQFLTIKTLDGYAVKADGELPVLSAL